MTPARLLHRCRRLRRPLVVGLLAPSALALAAAQAKADGESISMVQNDPSAVAGQAVNFTASGALNPNDTMFGFDVYIFAKDPDLDPTCAADLETEEAAAMNSGGNEVWVSPTGFQVGTGPSFTQPFKFTFSGAGPYLLCGYVQSDFSTVASGQLQGVVTAASSTGTGTPTPPAPPAPVAPAVVHAPWITRGRHVLICHSGRWSNSPSSLRYRWEVRGHARSIGSRRTLAVRRSLKGRRVLCRVTARNAAGARTASTRAIRVR